MIDLKVLKIQDLLPVAAAEFARGISPLSVVIQGEDFDQATQVLINDVVAPEYMILSKSRIIAEVPSSERSSVVRKLAVIAEKPSASRSSLLHFDVGMSIKGIKGLEKLVQIFCKLLLQSPGSDKFSPEDGGGLLSAVGKNISRHDTKSVQAIVVSAVNRTRDQILAKQSRINRLPSDERLLTARLDAVGFDPTTTTVSARIALAAVSGREAVANLSF